MMLKELPDRFFKLLNNPKLVFAIAISMLFAYFLPYLIEGQNAFLLIHDNLDSNLVWVKTLIDYGSIFGSPNESFDNIFNGLPRSSLYGTYDLCLIWFKIFGIYWGYVFNKLMMVLVAFFGMYLLIRKLDRSENPPIYIHV